MGNKLIPDEVGVHSGDENSFGRIYGRGFPLPK